MKMSLESIPTFSSPYDSYDEAQKWSNLWVRDFPGCINCYASIKKPVVTFVMKMTEGRRKTWERYLNNMCKKENFIKQKERNWCNQLVFKFRVLDDFLNDWQIWLDKYEEQANKDYHEQESEYMAGVLWDRERELERINQLSS